MTVMSCTHGVVNLLFDQFIKANWFLENRNSDNNVQ